jgi:hypothetical protein
MMKCIINVGAIRITTVKCVNNGHEMYGTNHRL